MKKIITLALALLMLVSLAACGTTTNTPGDDTKPNNSQSTNTPDSNQPANNSTEIKDITTSNYVEVTKKNFGIDPSVSGLKITKAKAQGSSQITMVFSIESGDEESFVKAFFEKCLDASDDKACYRQDWPNDGGYTITVGEKVTSWESWKQEEAFDQNWFYLVDGKYIAFGGSQQPGNEFEVTINFK